MVLAGGRKGRTVGEFGIVLVILLVNMADPFRLAFAALPVFLFQTRTSVLAGGVFSAVVGAYLMHSFDPTRPAEVYVIGAVASFADAVLVYFMLSTRAKRKSRVAKREGCGIEEGVG